MDEAFSQAGVTFPFVYGALTDKGKVRSENEDAYIVEPELGLFLVSDGMGGHRGGSVAANIVAGDLPVMVETGLGKLRSHSQRAIRRVFKETVMEQNRQLNLEAESETGHKGMGATLAMVLILAGRAYVANLGDSRVYRFRNRRLVQITKEHSVISELLDEGQIEPHEADEHSAAGQITHYIGMEEDAEPHVRTFTLKGGDRLLLCTDGLTDMVDEGSIGQMLAGGTGPQELCTRLVDKANKAGGDDNITAVVVDYLS